MSKYELAWDEKLSDLVKSSGGRVDKKRKSKSKSRSLKKKRKSYKKSAKSYKKKKNYKSRKIKRSKRRTLYTGAGGAGGILTNIAAGRNAALRNMGAAADAIRTYVGWDPIRPSRAVREVMRLGSADCARLVLPEWPQANSTEHMMLEEIALGYLENGGGLHEFIKEARHRSQLGLRDFGEFNQYHGPRPGPPPMKIKVWYHELMQRGSLINTGWIAGNLENRFPTEIENWRETMARAEYASGDDPCRCEITAYRGCVNDLLRLWWDHDPHDKYIDADADVVRLPGPGAATGIEHMMLEEIALSPFTHPFAGALGRLSDSLKILLEEFRQNCLIYPSAPHLLDRIDLRRFNIVGWYDYHLSQGILYETGGLAGKIRDHLNNLPLTHSQNPFFSPRNSTGGLTEVYRHESSDDY
jgi:hypothetical protein